MKKLSLNEIKNVSLEGLVYLRDFLEKYHLRYYLAWGTLLGAVRHHGFIPWDDDIDIWMPRKDYEVLLSKMDELENDEWKIIHYSNNRRYLIAWAKLVNKKSICKPSVAATGLCLGLSLDIFPLDNIDFPLKQAKDKVIALTAKGFLRLESFHPSIIDVKTSLFKRVAHYLYFYLKCLIDRPYQHIMEEYDKSLLKYDERSQSVVDLFSASRRVFDRNWFGKGTQVFFENESFIAPVDYDEVLKNSYGDYMTLPPIDQRVTNHPYSTYWL